MKSIGKTTPFEIITDFLNNSKGCKMLKVKFFLK